jgi:hypothetical protein
MSLRARVRLTGSRLGRTASVLAATVAMLTIVMTAQASATGIGPDLNASPLGSPAVPAVEKLVPNSGFEAGGTEVTIEGANFAEAGAVEFGSTSASFTVKSRSRLVAIAPAGVGTEDVRVTTPGGTSAIDPGDEFTYVSAAPTISALNPSEGTFFGGEKVRVVGTNLTGATAVYFGPNPVKSFKVISSTAISITTPVGYGTVNVTVVTPEGTSAIVPSDEFTYSGRPPGVSGVSPKLGPAAGGNAVGISGAGFIGVTDVYFGAVPAASFNVNSPTSITAVPSPGTAGRVEVTVTTVYGESPAQWCVKNRPCIILDYYKFAEPTITELSPDSGPEAGGTSVTVTGTGFAIGVGLTSFSFHAIPASEVECIALTMCTLVTPPHKAGTVPVTAAVGEYKTRQPMAAHFVYTR